MSDGSQPLYNPLSIDSIAESLVRKIQDTPCDPLPPVQPFLGAGVYMLYYKGSSAGYEKLAARNQLRYEQPIYVGKAAPKGGRIGAVGNNPTGQELYGRLVEHAESIRAAQNLD